MTKTKKWLSVILAMLLLVTVLAGCGGNPNVENSNPPDASNSPVASGPVGGEDSTYERKTPEGTLTVGYLDGIQGGFDMITDENHLAHDMVYDTLFTVNPATDELECLLAESYEWVDDTHLQITLKSNAKFADGTPVTSEDVLYSLRRILDENASCVQLSYWIDHDNCSIESDTVFTIATYEPFPGAVRMLSGHTWACILPKHFCETASAEDFWSNPVGSGPYKVVSNTNGVNTVYELREDYWNIDNLVTDAKTVEIKYYTSNQTMMLDYNEGLLDMVLSADSAEYDKVINGETKDTVASLLLNNDPTYLILPECRETLADINVRKAISLAIDTEAVTEMVYGVAGAPAESIFGTTVAYYESQGEHVYDPEQARELMEAAGYSDSNKLVLGIYADTGEIMVRMCTVLEQYLSQIYIQMDIHNVDRNAVIEQIITGGTDFLVHDGVGIGTNHPYEAVMSFKADSNPTEAIQNPELNELLNAASAETDEAKAAELYGDVQEWVVSNYYLIPFTEKHSVNLYRPYIKSFTSYGDMENLTLRNIVME